MIDLEVTSNRGDCLGHVGVAREIAVLYGEELKGPQGSPSPLGGAPSRAGAPPSGDGEAGRTGEAIPVEIRAPDLCSVYTARIVRGVTVGESPQWVKDRLAALGQRSVNNVADATNLAMLETGQPFHAFDLAKLRGGRIVVRLAEKGETFTALDGKSYELPAGTGVIADAEHPVAVAGRDGLGGQRDRPGDGRRAARSGGLPPENGSRRRSHAEPPHRRQPSVRARRRRLRARRTQSPLRRPRHRTGRRDAGAGRGPSPDRCRASRTRCRCGSTACRRCWGWG